MNTRTKTSGILFGTLALGMILGIAGNRIYLQSRIRQFREMPPGRMMIHRISDVILQPTDDQIAVIEPILDKYAEKFWNEHLKSRERAQALLDSLQTELKPHLTKEQFSRLQDRRMPPMGGPPFWEHGAPPDSLTFFPRGPEFGHENYRLPIDDSLMRRIPPDERGFPDKGRP